MKSYYKFLESSQAAGVAVSDVRKPVYRSSAIFPVLETKDIHSRILFMGYWNLKREIREVTLLHTLRDQKGLILKRFSGLIDTTKAFSIEVGEILEEARRGGIDFIGSLEIEVFSTRNLVFPYPAFVLCYYNDRFSTAVHTVGRIYNDIEDWKENEETPVAESGFDVYPDANRRPFVAFTNGPLADPSPKLEVDIVKPGGLTVTSGDIRLAPLAPFETVFLSLRDHLDFSKLNGEAGTIKMRHAFKGFFPRLVAGNFQDGPSTSVSVTHTYYDCSSQCADTDYWKRTDPQYHDASILVPVFSDERRFTELAFYPIYSPARFSLCIDFHDTAGRLLGRAVDWRRYDTSKPIHERVNLADVAKQNGVDVSILAGAHLKLDAAEGSRFPTRLKMGLNVGVANTDRVLPCNICFAPKVGDVNADKKPRSFRWAPFLNVGNSVVVVTNAAPVKGYSREAKVLARFFRESDSTTMEREYLVEAFGQVRIGVKSDRELLTFFGGRPGWITMESTNPRVNAWYFDFGPDGTVAGDHGF